MAANKITKSNDGQISDGGGNSCKRRYGSMSGKNTFKSPTKVLQHAIFDYNARKNNKNVFLEDVNNLRHNIAGLGAFRYEAPKVAYKFRTLTEPTFVMSENTENYYKFGYNEIELKYYFAKAKGIEKKIRQETTKFLDIFLSHFNPIYD